MPRGAVAIPACSARIHQKCLKHDGQQHEAAIEHKAKRGHQEYARGVCPVSEHPQIDHGMAHDQLVRDKHRQSNSRDDGQGRHRVRSEPVLLLALVEQDLQAGHPECQHADTPVVHAA